MLWLKNVPDSASEGSSYVKAWGEGPGRLFLFPLFFSVLLVLWGPGSFHTLVLYYPFLCMKWSALREGEDGGFICLRNYLRKLSLRPWFEVHLLEKTFS
jgi:hypothetical protein